MFGNRYFKYKTALLLLLIISVIIMVTSTVAFANEKQYKEQNRSGSVPQLVTNDTHPSTVNACVRVNSQYMFGGRLEEYFTDPENDPITFWVKQDNGSYSQNLITTITDGNDTYTSFIYTPTVVETTTFEVAASDNNGVTFSSPITVNLTVCATNTSNVITTTVNYPSNVTDFVIKDANGIPVLPKTPNSDIYDLERGTYTFRGKPNGGTQASGMTFDIPTTVNVDGTDVNPDTVYIKQANITVNANSVAQRAYKYSLSLTDSDSEAVTLGIDMQNSMSTTVPALVYAHGNAELYTFEVKPIDSSLSGYATLYQGNQTFTVDTNAQTVTLALPLAVNYDINVPTGATLEVFRQVRNYQIVEVDEDDIIGPVATSEGDSYTCKLPQNGTGYTYRVSDTDKVTHAGFINLGSNSPLESDVNLSEDDKGLTLAQATANPSLEEDNLFSEAHGYDTNTTIGSRAEDSVLLNAHVGPAGNYSALYHNYINLPVGQSYKIRGYRGAWQIINSDTANIMIEPDFHFQVVEGTASDLTLNQDSIHNSWCTVTPNSGASGVYVIKVTYDAIDVDGMSYSNNAQQRFYATANGREGYIVINVNSNKYADMTLNAETSGSRDANMDWDSEIDTVYYTGNQGTFKFAPAISGKTISSVQFSTTPGGTYTNASYANGKYTVHPVQGYNMIKVTCSDNTVAYAPIRAAQIRILVDNVDLATNPTVSVNTNHTIKLDGVYMPVPKFSGIYNPMMNKANYTVGNSTVSGNNLQYNFITQNKITWKPTSAGTYNFTNGYHSMRMFCNTTAKWGHHRLLTDAGVGANFNAGQVNGVFNIYPNFTITVS